jgi:hypothetical protein
MSDTQSGNRTEPSCTSLLVHLKSDASPTPSSRVSSQDDIPNSDDETGELRPASVRVGGDFRSDLNSFGTAECAPNALLFPSYAHQ